MERISGFNQLRQQAESKLTRRLRLSMWARRGIMALSIAAGAWAGNQSNIADNENRETAGWEEALPGTIITSSAFGTMLEMGMAQKTCRQHVQDYKDARIRLERQNGVVCMRRPGTSLRSVADVSDPATNGDRLRMGAFFASPVVAGFTASYYVDAPLAEHADIYRSAVDAAIAVPALGMIAASALTVRQINRDQLDYYRNQLDMIDANKLAPA